MTIPNDVLLDFLAQYLEYAQDYRAFGSQQPVMKFCDMYGLCGNFTHRYQHKNIDEYGFYAFYDVIENVFGDNCYPFGYDNTPLNEERIAWVKESIERLKKGEDLVAL